MPAKREHLLDPDKIHIAKTAIIKYHIDSTFDFQSEKVKTNEIKMEYNIAFNLEDKLVKIDFQVEVITDSKGENLEEAKGTFHLVYVFHVENLEELATSDKKNRIELNGLLANVLASITYSTTRGMLIVRLKGTAFENFVLPIIDPNTLLDGDSKN